MTSVLKDKQDANEAAKQNVDNALNALKGVGVKEAQSALENATQKQSNVETEINNTNKSIQNLQENINQIQTKISQAQTLKSNAEAAQSKAQQNAQSAASTLKKANSDFEAQKSEIDKLNNQLNDLKDQTKNTIDLVDANKFKKAFSDYELFHWENITVGKNGGFTDDDIEYLKAARSKNKYQSIEADKNKKVDINNLTDEQLNDLSLFTANILNKVRMQLGLSSDNTQVTAGSVDMAKLVAKEYTTDYKADKWHPSDNWHDDAALQRVVSKTHTALTEEMEASNLPEPVTMDDLKCGIYNNLIDMILTNGNGIDSAGAKATYELAHAQGLLGLGFPSLEEMKSEIKEIKADMAAGHTSGSSIDGKMYYNQDYIDKANSLINEIEKNHQYIINTDDMDPMHYVGVSFTVHGTKYGKVNTMIHFINSVSFDTRENSHFVKSKAIQSYDSQLHTVNENIKTENSKLTPLTEKVEAATKENKSKILNLNAANAALGSANVTLNNLNSNLKDENLKLSAAKQKVANLSRALKEATNELNAAKETYNNLTASQSQKVKNYNNAVEIQKATKADLAQAQSNLNNANAVLAAAQTQLKNLQNIANEKAVAVATAQTAYETAKKRVEALKNAPQVLADATATVAKAQAAYDAVKKAADEAATQLKALAPAKTTADAKVAAAQSEYDSALANLKAAQDKLANAKAALEQIKQSEDMMNQFVPNIISDNTSSSENSSVGSNSTSGSENSSVVSNITSDNNSGSENTSVSASEYKSVKLTHNAYIYTKALKTVKNSNKKNIVLKKGSYLKALNNGKVYVIKGKKYYQIGKNKFVKVANTLAKKSKSYVAVVKGRKNHKVRVYLGNGKFAKKYVYGQRYISLPKRRLLKARLITEFLVRNFGFLQVN
ncbi:SEC10/PgrA surface exclusion domain-containing protein [uncultured Lactobacillus sp.]|uniref:SEC10/PgrA surface exclusion domain-containing protein n=1 Tax=uncultured Lactobacillus sp. TaxID=153152 RepID=UPI0028065604|nr:SEC10/PgrA surface exclusion domain-containing protein [uncultured Lactobacillus sp.]